MPFAEQINTTSDLLDNLNFNYRTVDDFNNILSYPVKTGQLSFIILIYVA